MTDINWNLIQSGPEFESFIGLLLAFEDPGSSHYGRSGKDWKQDIRSYDKKTIYQVKHHKNNSISKVILDVKNELVHPSKGLMYHLEEKHEKWVNFWKGVENYVMVAFIKINPNDQDKWEKAKQQLEEEIKSTYSNFKLNLDYWTLEDIEALLINHPNVKEEFFGGKNRLFLTIPEIKQINFLPDSHAHSFDNQIKGRDPDFEIVDQFIHNEKKLILSIEGPGGIGKTRFIIGSGDYIKEKYPIWYVLWVNNNSIKYADNWFNRIPHSQHIIFIIDEPDEIQLINAFVEQISQSYGRTCKLIISLRSSNTTMINEMRRHHRIQEKRILEPIEKEASIDLVKDLIDNSSLSSKNNDWKVMVAELIAKKYDYYPGWMFIGVEVLESIRNEDQLPDTREELSQVYLEQIYNNLKKCNRFEAETLLQWIAINRKVLSSDLPNIRYLKDIGILTNFSSLTNCQDDLLEKKILFKRGKLLEFLFVKPDIIADRLLIVWLTQTREDEYIPSETSKIIISSLVNAIENAKFSNFHKSILESIARVEYVLNVEYKIEVELIKYIFDHISSILYKWSPVQRKLLLDVLLIIGPLYPTEIIDIVNIMIVNPTATIDPVKTYFGDRNISNQDVVLDFSWLLYNSARFSSEEEIKKNLLKLLCKVSILELDILEENPKMGRNDGKRGINLIPRLVSEGEFDQTYETQGFKLANTMLEMLKQQEIHEFWPSLIEYIIYPLLKIDKTTTKYSNDKFMTKRYLVDPTGNLWHERIQLISNVKKILELSKGNQEIASWISINTITELWGILKTAHSECNRARGTASKEAPNQVQVFVNELENNMEWTKLFLQNLDMENLDIKELTSIKGIWDWHLSYEKNSKLKQLAQDCEKEYLLKNTFSQEYDTIYKINNHDKMDENAIKKGLELINKDISTIDEFIAKGIDYLGERTFSSYITLTIASTIGENIEENKALQDAVLSNLEDFLKEDEYSIKFDFYCYICKGWLKNNRNQNLTPEVIRLLDLFISKLNKSLIPKLFSVTHNSSWAISMDLKERELLYSLSEEFRSQDNHLSIFVAIISGIAHYDWDSYKKIIDTVFDDLITNRKFNTLDNCINNAIQNINYIYKKETAEKISLPNLEWLADQVNKLSDLNSHILFSFNVLLDGNKLSICWYVKATKDRIEYKTRWKNEKFRIVPYNRFSQFINEINGSNKNEKDCLKQLIQLILDKPIATYFLDQEISTLDPQASVLSTVISDKLIGLNISKKEDRLSLGTLSKIIGSYEENSIQWRKLSPLILKTIKNFDKKSKYNFMASLKGSKGVSYSSAVNEVPPYFYNQVELITKWNETETDDIFNEYWKYRLEVAKYDLQLEKERLREDLDN